MTERFPSERVASAQRYFDAYVRRLAEAAGGLDRDKLDQAVSLLEEIFARGSTLYVCGNGGSAAISNHMTCDVLKGVQTDTDLTPRVMSLSTQMELITAIANDIDYRDVFAYQLRTFARDGDGLITISASGDSENVVRALDWARENGLATIAMTGFSGGRCAKLADVNLHVPASNYGIIEDVHQSIMHVMAQYLRMSGMQDSLVGKRYF